MTQNYNKINVSDVIDCVASLVPAGGNVSKKIHSRELIMLGSSLQLNNILCSLVGVLNRG